MQHIDVVIVTYNSAEYLPRLAGSLRDSARPVSVTVVDNASADESVAVALGLDWGCKVRVLEQGSNIGFGAAMNIGVLAQHDSQELVLLINPDVALEGGALDELIAALNEQPKLACVGGVLTTSDGRPVSSARALPTSRSIARRRVREVVPSSADGMATTAGWVCGALMLWRRSVFTDVGGFSPTYFLYFEDVDICRKAADLGFIVGISGRARAVHDQGHGAPPSRFLEKTNRHSRRIYVRRWLGGFGPLAAATADVGDFAARIKRRVSGDAS